LSRFDQNFMPQVLIIDSIGLLSSVYKYAWISYIGGGFGKGIHNTLEAAVYGRPVLFGPRYDKFIEAADLIALGGGYSIHSAEDLLRLCALWEGNPDSYAASSQAASEYVLTHTGGTKKIYQSLAAKLSAES
jgi:3-deoxy-D-manno-octulosonic-acid transferase